MGGYALWEWCKTRGMTVLDGQPCLLHRPKDNGKKNADRDGEQGDEEFGKSKNPPTLCLHLFYRCSVFTPLDTPWPGFHQGIQRCIVETEFLIQQAAIEYDSCLHPKTFTNHPPERDTCQRVWCTVPNWPTADVAVTTSKPDLASVGRIARLLRRISNSFGSGRFLRGCRKNIPYSRSGRRFSMIEVRHKLSTMLIKSNRMTENSNSRVVCNEMQFFAGYADWCNRIPSALLDKIRKGKVTLIPDTNEVNDHVGRECTFVYSAILYSIFVI